MLKLWSAARRSAGRQVSSGLNAASDVGWEWMHTLAILAADPSRKNSHDLIAQAVELDEALDAILGSQRHLEILHLLAGVRRVVRRLSDGVLKLPRSTGEVGVLDPGTARAPIMTLPVQGSYAFGRASMLLALQSVDAMGRGDHAAATSKADQALRLFDGPGSTSEMVDFMTGLRVEANDRLLGLFDH